MNTGDLLTVKEFAAAAGVSTQRIYKAMKTTLQPYVANTENGLTMLKSDGLREFGLPKRGLFARIRAALSKTPRRGKACKKISVRPTPRGKITQNDKNRNFKGSLM